MPHPTIVNSLPFMFEPLYLADAEGRPILAMVVKATFDLQRNAQIADNQAPVFLAGSAEWAPTFL